jgi:hypothetical protein
LVERTSRGKYCAGQWKDIQSFNDSLQNLSSKFEYVEFAMNALDGVLARCRELNAAHIILYYSFHPEVLDLLRKELPGVKLYVRTVNAEAFQHWQRSEVRFKPTYNNLRSVYGSVRLAWRDSLCKRYADGLFGISEWDNRYYWNRLPGKAVVSDVPYTSPWPVIRAQVKTLTWSDRENEIVCLAGGRDAIGRTMIAGFNQLADSVGHSSDFQDWKFSLSPGILRSSEEDAVSSRVERMDSLEEPWDLLCRVRALAVLTPLGFGCKTTIIDALAAGCHVLVHPTLAARLAADVRVQCIEVMPGKVPQASWLAERLQSEPKVAHVNQVLKATATEALMTALKQSVRPAL